MTKSTKATIRVEIWNEELNIDEICDPLEGAVGLSAAHLLRMKMATSRTGRSSLLF